MRSSLSGSCSLSKRARRLVGTSPCFPCILFASEEIHVLVSSCYTNTESCCRLQLQSWELCVCVCVRLRWRDALTYRYLACSSKPLAACTSLSAKSASSMVSVMCIAGEAGLGMFIMMAISFGPRICAPCIFRRARLTLDFSMELLYFDDQDSVRTEKSRVKLAIPKSAHACRPDEERSAVNSDGHEAEKR